MPSISSRENLLDRRAWSKSEMQPVPVQRSSTRNLGSPVEGSFVGEERFPTKDLRIKRAIRVVYASVSGLDK